MARKISIGLILLCILLAAYILLKPHTRVMAQERAQDNEISLKLEQVIKNQNKILSILQEMDGKLDQIQLYTNKL